MTEKQANRWSGEWWLNRRLVLTFSCRESGHRLGHLNCYKFGPATWFLLRRPLQHPSGRGTLHTLGQRDLLHFNAGDVGTSARSGIRRLEVHRA